MIRLADPKARLILFLGVSFAPPAAPVWAQASAGLARAEELTVLGRPEEARFELMQWWNGASDGASRGELQRALWLRARLTVDPVQAELDFRRLVVLYPRGTYTPRALFRLAQAEHEMGDEEASRSYVQTLARDFPGSTAREEAEAWLVSAGPAPPPPGGSAPGENAVPVDVPGPRSPPVGQVAGSATEPSAEDGFYFVQLGAFAEGSRASALAEEVLGQGIDVRVVRVDGSRFFHVRFGRFVRRERAVQELERLTGMGVTVALVRDERPELPLGGG